MALTEADLQTQVQDAGYATDTASQQARAIKATWRRVLGMRRWKFLDKRAGVSIATGLGGVDLAPLITDLAQVSGARLLVDGYLLKFIPSNEMLDRQALDTDTGTPEYWSMYGTTLFLHPIPNRTYVVTVEYKMAPTYSTTDILFPELHQDVLVWGAVMRLARRQRDWNGVADAKAEYQDALRALIHSYGIEQRQSTAEVGRSV